MSLELYFTICVVCMLFMSIVLDTVLFNTLTLKKRILALSFTNIFAAFVYILIAIAASVSV